MPKKIRDRFHIVPRADLELEKEHDGIRTRPVADESAVVHTQGILVHRGFGSVTLDMAEVVNHDRRDRADRIVAKIPSG